MVSLILNKFKYINLPNKYLIVYADDSKVILQTGIYLKVITSSRERRNCDYGYFLESWVAVYFL